MKFKILKLILLVLTGSGFIQLAAQPLLHINENTGSRTSFAITEIRCLTFPSENLLLTLYDGASQDIPLNRISSLVFSNAQSTFVAPELEKDDGTNLHVYPNPFTEEITLQFWTEKNVEIQIQIMDLQGKFLIRKPVILHEGDQRLAINLADLPKGLYLCTIRSDSYIKTCKLLKN